MENDYYFVLWNLLLWYIAIEWYSDIISNNLHHYFKEKVCQAFRLSVRNSITNQFRRNTKSLVVTKIRFWHFPSRLRAWQRVLPSNLLNLINSLGVNSLINDFKSMYSTRLYQYCVKVSKYTYNLPVTVGFDLSKS
jgi:hypothetical protein